MNENRTLASRLDEENLLVPSARPLTAAGAGERPGTSLLTIIWRRRWVFLGCILLALAGGIVYLSRCTPLYSSSAQIYAQQGAPKVLADLLSTNAASMNYLFTQCDLIRSTAVVAPALEAPEVRQCKTLRNVDNPVAYVRRATEATVGKQSDLITVSVEAPYPEDAALLTNAIVDSYINYQDKRQQKTAGDLLAQFQKDENDRKTEVQVATDALLAFKRANASLTFGSEKGNIVTQRLEELSGDLTRAQLDTIQCKLLAEAATSIGDDPVKLKQLLVSQAGSASLGPQVQSAADNQDLWAEYRRLHRLADQAREMYGPEHAMVKNYAKQLAELKNEIMDLDSATVANYRSVIQQQYVSAQAREQELQKRVESEKAEAVTLNSKEAEWQTLDSNLKRAQTGLELVQARIKELRFGTDTPPQRIDILEVARPSGLPVKPNYPRTMGMALVIGLLSGLGAALLQDWADQRMRSVEEIQAVLDLTVLGVIPHMIGKHPPAERGQEVHLRPRSNVAEAYRTVRTAIFFGVPDLKNKTLLVTSPSPGDGKTTMASNLAIAIAQSGRRVILIDADMRKPMQHRIFNLKDETGLSTVLLGQTKLEQTAQRTGVENLDVLPCGPLPPNPSEILNSQQFLDMVNLLCLRYDQVVIDSPPVEPVTDARILAASCDVTVLVLRAEKSTRRLSAHARDALIGVGANLLGCIVNDVPRGREGYSYYSGYGYYHYGYGSRNAVGSSSSASSGRKEIKAIAVASEEES